MVMIMVVVIYIVIVTVYLLLQFDYSSSSSHIVFGQSCTQTLEVVRIGSVINILIVIVLVLVIILLVGLVIVDFCVTASFGLQETGYISYIHLIPTRVLPVSFLVPPQTDGARKRVFQGRRGWGEAALTNSVEWEDFFKKTTLASSVEQYSTENQHLP